jgi:putative flippase GtrA
MMRWLGIERMRESHTQLLRYLLVGALSNSVGYLVFLLIAWWGGAPKVAMTLVYVTGALTGFFGNRNWTFRDRGGTGRSAFFYFLAHGSGYSLNWLLLYVFVDRFGYPHQVVQLAAMVMVALVLFVELKYLVFREKG